MTAAAPERFWCRIDHDFARDTALVETADRCETSPAVVLSIAVQLRIRENEDRPLGPADLDSLAWFCRVPDELVRRIVETLVKLGRLARAVLSAITRRLPDDRDRARCRAAQQRFRQKRRQDRRQLNLLLPITPPITPDYALTPADAKPAESRPPDPPEQRLPTDSTPTAQPSESREEPELETPSFHMLPTVLEQVAQYAQKEEVSKRFTLSAFGRRKRANMLKTLRRWVHTNTPVAERADVLAMLGRAEYALDDWASRSLADKHWLDMLKRKADRRPLDEQTTQFHYLAEHGAAYRSRRHWRRAMEETASVHQAAGLPDMPFTGPAA